MLNKTNICSAQSFLTGKTVFATVAVTLDIYFLCTSICVASPTIWKR